MIGRMVIVITRKGKKMSGRKLKKVEDNFFPFLLWYIVVSTILAYFRFPFFPTLVIFWRGKIPACPVKSIAQPHLRRRFQF